MPRSINIVDTPCTCFAVKVTEQEGGAHERRYEFQDKCLTYAEMVV